MGLSGAGGTASVPDESGWQRFRLIADNASDVVYETTPDGVIVWVSDTVTTLLGHDADALCGTVARELVHPDDRERVEELRRLVYAGTDLDGIPCRFRTALGSYRTTTVRARAQRDDDGVVTGSVVVLRDTHEKDAMLRALTTLSRGNGVLVRARDESGLLQRMCETIVEAGAYPFAWFGRPVQDERRSVQCVASAGGHTGYLDSVPILWAADDPRGQGPTGRCLRSGRTQVLHDFRTDHAFGPWLEAAARHGFRCSIALPVLVDGDVDGALMVYSGEPGTFDPMAQSLLEDLAADVGYGLARLRDGARLAEALDSSVYVLAAAVESRDPYTAGHQSQVGAYSAAIGRELGLDAARIQGLTLGASIHDLGKIAVPHDVLLKQGPLSEEEWELLRRHPRIGQQIVDRFPWPWPIAEMIHQHHERLDGSGYPRGLRGAEILLESSVIAVADTFEAMAHDRPYRVAPGVEAALDVLHRGRGRRYDADVVDALDRMLERDRG